MGCVTVTSSETPTRPERINVITAKGKLFGKAPLPLSPLINKSTGAGKLQNHGFLVVRKRRSLTVSTSLDQHSWKWAESPPVSIPTNYSHRL